jgi:uncharacterized protein YoxC
MVEIASPHNSNENKSHKFLSSMGWVICLVVLLLAFLTVIVGYEMQKKAYHRIDVLEQSISEKQGSDQGLSDQYGEIQEKLQEISLEINNLKADLSERVGKLEAEHKMLRDIDKSVQDAVKKAKTASQDLATKVETLATKFEDLFST